MDIIPEKLNLINTLKNRKQDGNYEEIYDLLDFLTETGEFHLEKLQKEFIKNLNYFVPFCKNLTKSGYELDWPYMAEEITKGIYPLEKIPSHLREYTAKLYYINENT